MASGSRLPLRLTDDLIGEYLDFLRSRDRSAGRIGKCKAYLEWFKDFLPDLRRLRHDDVHRALKDAPNPGGRISVIKSFWGWLRVEHDLDFDPLENLHAPSSVPEQFTRSKIIHREWHDEVVKTIGAPWADLLTVLAGTGWHIS